MMIMTALKIPDAEQKRQSRNARNGSMISDFELPCKSVIGQTISCQMCKGKGWSGPVHINRGNGPHEWVERLPCNDCGGSGSWSMDRWNAWQIGQALRNKRIARDESLRECAQQMGIPASKLSAIERGKDQEPVTGNIPTLD